MNGLAKQIQARAQAYDPTDRCLVKSLAADIVYMCCDEAEKWTNRIDDAVRIPDMLSDTARELRKAR